MLETGENHLQNVLQSCVEVLMTHPPFLVLNFSVRFS